MQRVFAAASRARWNRDEGMSGRATRTAARTKVNECPQRIERNSINVYQQLEREINTNEEAWLAREPHAARSITHTDQRGGPMNTDNVKSNMFLRLMNVAWAINSAKITRSGLRSTRKENSLVELCPGKLGSGIAANKNDESEGVPILARGLHQFPFSFDLPQTTLPCSLESRHGTIRYYIKVIIDIPYASSPQGIKYFTIIGPHLDCMEEKYLVGGY
ncbi:arrestin domain protein [Teladorsagia circumcincta]|uniref:Arrestin domain protein n=1 Tax=Teladorsagia circumcincta TaxID=45464 RepID=A0A2G9UYT2_TELCI|nr:arrestin domain protein [Teladorsagia circumcincta]